MITPLPYVNFYLKQGCLAIMLVLTSTAFLLANGNKPCKATAAQGDDHAVWLSKYKDGKEANYLFDQQGGYLVENDNGTASVYGTIYNEKDPQDQWEVQLWLSDRMDWNQWSALGRGYKDENNKAGKLYKTWSYYIMDPSKDSKLVGKGKNNGIEVPLRHNPINFHYAFQVGEAANSKNAKYGMSGWFLYFLNSDEPRPGDFNLDLTCSPSEPNDSDHCPDCFSSELIKSSTNENGCTVYTLEVKNDGGCRHGLSHYTVDIPCGEVSNISNSEGWKVEIGKDPTTGLNGFKVDDINGFGESDQPGSFQVEFTVCPDGTCGQETDCQDLEIAHKAGLCITTESLPVCEPNSGENPGGNGDGNDGDPDGSGDGDVSEGNPDPDCDVNELAANMITSNVTCAGAQDGSASIEIIGGLAPFTFEWSNGAGSQDLTGLAAGNYTVTITDANDVTVQLSGTVHEPDMLSVSGITSPASCEQTNGSVMTNVSGGTGPFTYNWSNGSTEKDLTGLSEGTYELTVTDANGCQTSDTYTILTSSGMLAEINNDDCGNLTLTVTNGAPPYNYEWSTGETTKDITVGSDGTYSVNIIDAFGCSVSSSITVSGLVAFDLSVVETQPSCSGTTDGALNLTVSGGVAPYSYQWTNENTGAAVSTVEDPSGLASGNYTVEVTDGRGCTRKLTHFLRNPMSMLVTADVTYISCDGNQADGAITIDRVIPSGNYSYSWSNGATTESITDLGPGTYTVTVTNDDTGCTVEKSFNLTPPMPPQVDVTLQYCGGRICPTYSSSEDLTFEWTTPGGNTMNSFDGCVDATEVGTYTLKVINVHGCEKVFTYSVGALIPALSTSISVTQPTCGGSGTGSATVSITGGEAPYTISWSKSTSTTNTASDLTAGTHMVTVTDKNGCKEARVFSIQQPQGPEISANSITEVSCNGESDGSIDIAVVGGTSPYTYAWSNGATSEDVSALAAGTHSVTVTDAGGCSTTMSFDLMVNPDNTNCDSGNGDGGNDGGDGGDGDGSGDGDGDGNNDPCIRDCNTCDGNVIALTLKYLGDEPNATIVVRQNNDGQVIYNGIVAPDGEFSFTGTDNMGTMTSEITITINGIDETLIHTSCSQPIGPGLVAGEFEVVLGESRNGGLLCPVEDGTEQEEQVTETEEQEQSEEPRGQDCAECHESQLISVEETEAGCITYTVEVTNNGACAHALSHYSIRIPCGIVTDASNSGGWNMELNSKDPATNLYGLKVDDIHGFGEDGQAGSFTVTYTVCPNQDESCIEKLIEEDIIVGYKAAQCAKIEKLGSNEQVAENLLQPEKDTDLTFVRFSVYPNPVEANSFEGLKLEFQEANIGEELNVKLANVTGKIFQTTNIEISRANEVLSLRTAGMAPGIYYVTVTSHHKVYSEKIIIK